MGALHIYLPEAYEERLKEVPAMQRSREIQKALKKLWGKNWKG